MTSDVARMADVLGELEHGERAWAALPLSGRIELLAELQASVAGARAGLGRDRVLHRAAPSRVASARGKKWISDPYPFIASTAALRRKPLIALERGGSPIDGFAIRQAPGGRVALRVLPHSLFDRLLFSGFEVEHLDATGRRGGNRPAARRPGAARPRPYTGHRRRARRRQHHLDRAARLALPAARRQPRLRAEAEPGDGPVEAGVRARARSARRPRLRADRDRRRRGGRSADRRSARVGGAHDRRRGDPRCDRVRHQRRGRGEQGRRTRRPRQAGDQRARRRLAGDRAARALVGGRPAPSRPSTSRPSGCTTAASTASRRRC